MNVYTACTRGLYSPAIQQQEENRKPIQQHLIPVKSLKTATDGGWVGWDSHTSHIWLLGLVFNQTRSYLNKDGTGSSLQQPAMEE